jgi:hypothetical protein
MKRDASKVFDPQTAYRAGRAFYANAGDFFSQVPTDLNDSARFIVGRVGRFVAAVTNLCLAIELYLKCLAIMSGSPVRQTHDLVALFDALPAALRTSLESRYKLKVDHLPNIPVAMIVRIATVDAPPSHDDPSIGQPKPHSSGGNLRALLVHEKNAFQTWRYLHEGGKRGEAMFYHVEYYFLGVLASVLEEHIEGKKLPGMTVSTVYKHPPK